MKGTDFPLDDLSEIREIAFRNVLLSALALALGALILSIPQLPYSGCIAGLGTILAGAGLVCMVVYTLNWWHVCIWTLAEERRFRARLKQLEKDK